MYFQKMILKIMKVWVGINQWQICTNNNLEILQINIKLIFTLMFF